VWKVEQSHFAPNKAVLPTARIDSRNRSHYPLAITLVDVISKGLRNTGRSVLELGPKPEEESNAGSNGAWRAATRGCH
jgi:hypothetical protein